MSSFNKSRTVLVCRGTGCNSLNAKMIHEELISLIQEFSLFDTISIKLTGCHGFCQIGPTLIIQPDNVLYAKLRKADIKEIVEQHLINNIIVDQLLYKDPDTLESRKSMPRMLFHNCCFNAVGYLCFHPYSPSCPYPTMS